MRDKVHSDSKPARSFPPLAPPQARQPCHLRAGAAIASTLSVSEVVALPPPPTRAMRLKPLETTPDLTGAQPALVWALQTVQVG